MSVKGMFSEFTTGFMGGNHRSTPYTKAGKSTRKRVNTAYKLGGTFLKRHPYIAVGTGLLSALGLDLAFTNNLGFDEQIKQNMPPYITSTGSDYEKDYKAYWKNVLGHDGVPKLEDFQDYDDPELEYNTAIQIYSDTRPY